VESRLDTKLQFFCYIIFQFETVAADCILCLVGDDQSTDTSPDLENTDFDDPISMDSTDDPGTEVDNIKRMFINNMRSKKFHTVGTIPKPSRKIVDLGKIDTS
jgi:hypothetical protein